jgi:uncharacterized membrane protein YkvA (DUF1232 family)
MADWLSNVKLHDTPSFNELPGLARFRVTIRVMRDPRVGGWMKWVVPMVTILYMMSPVNLIPDFQLVAGELDDLFVASLAMAGMMKLVPLIVPAEIVDEHIEAFRNGS